jgi:uncharacterized protein (TIGR02757 family)
MRRKSGHEIRIRELRALMDDLHDRFNRPEFIESDPVSVAHRYRSKGDIEVAGLLTATIAWGNRKSILASADRMLGRMGESPLDFVMEASAAQLARNHGAVHRTFSNTDLAFFVRALRAVYGRHGGPEAVFTRGFSQHHHAAAAIHDFRKIMLQTKHEARSEKHLADPFAGSSAKRINMFLRWMVRRDGRGVDLGIWSGIDPADLSVPLDVHSGNMARSLGLLRRPSNDRKAVEELDAMLRILDPADPVKYDFALFGLGVSGEAVLLPE